MPRRIGPGGPFLVPRNPPDATPDQAGPSGGRGMVLRFLEPCRTRAYLWPDEELPIATAPTALEDDSFSLSMPAAAWPPAQRALIERAEEWIASIPVDDDLRYVSGFAGYPQVRPFVGDDDAWMASIGVDDDQRFVSAFAGYPQVAPFVERDDALLSSILVDDDQRYVSEYRGYAPARVFVGDDDAWMASIGVEEDSPALVRIVAWAYGRPLVFEEDALPPQAAAAALEEDPWRSTLFVPVRVPRPFLAEEDWIASITVEEDGWWILPPGVRAVLRLAIHDAEILASGLAPGVFPSESPARFRIGARSMRLGEIVERLQTERLGEAVEKLMSVRLGEAAEKLQTTRLGEPVEKADAERLGSSDTKPPVRGPGSST